MIKIHPIKAMNGEREILQTLVVQKKLTQQDVDDLLNGKKDIYSATMFARKKLGQNPGGKIDVITKADKAEIGITNFESGKVPSDMNFICTGMQINYGFSATEIDPSAVDYRNTIFAIDDEKLDAGTVATGNGVVSQFIPTRYVNAEYKVASTAGGQLMAGMVKDALNYGVSSDGVNHNESNVIVLRQPKLFKANQDLTLELLFPAAGTFAAGYHYTEVLFQGFSLSSKEA
jgi:hypothetical protein